MEGLKTNIQAASLTLNCFPVGQ